MLPTTPTMKIIANKVYSRITSPFIDVSVLVVAFKGTAVEFSIPASFDSMVPEGNISVF